MPIVHDENGFLILDIPANGNNEGKSLPDSNFYFNTLNEESFAFSNVDTWGCITDPYSFDGHFIQTEPDKFGVILGHEFSPFIYRGQNMDYPHFLPTANRYDLKNENEQLKHCIDWVKKQEFLHLFKRTPYYERCEKFRVLNCTFKFDLEAIAQHYEFMSHYIDITKELLTAMFFAYTYQANGKYYPINDFEKYSPTLYIGNLSTIYKQQPECLKIIGFQALLRPHLQKAMAVEIKEEDTIKPLFEKIELPKSYAFACEIFNKANGGKNLFPNDFISNVAMQIKQEKSLNIEFLKEYCHIHNRDFKLFTEKLKNIGYTVIIENWQIPTNAWYRINREIDEYIIPYLNERIAFRGVSEPLYKQDCLKKNSLH